MPVARLEEFRPSSYWYLGQEAKRPAFLRVGTALAEAGGLPDTAAGRRIYADYLPWQAEEGPAGRSKAYVKLSEGWALGTGEFKAALMKDHALAAEARAWESVGAREIRAARWDEELGRCLRRLGKTSAEVDGEPKSAPWKAAVALRLKETTQAGDRWLTERLNMGRPEAVSVDVGRLKAAGAETDEAYSKLTTIV